MRAFVLALLLVAGPLDAQTDPLAPVAAPPPPPPTAPIPIDPNNPALAYITAGQDEPGYRSWYLALPARAAQVKAFNDYLVGAEVGGIVPTWQLFRTATSWKDCGAQPFEIPPTEEWPNIVQTLRYVRDYVNPALGPVEPVSVYRNPALNVCAGGAPESAHKLYSAIDMVPLKPITRETMMRTLCIDHSAHGEAYRAGLGFYAYMRFHVDSIKYRRWNMDPAVAAECPPIVHPEDAASIGQPIPATPAALAPQVPPAPVPQTLPKTERGQPH